MARKHLRNYDPDEVLELANERGIEYDSSLPPEELRGSLLRQVAESMSDDELSSLDEVKSNKHVRDHREDWIAVALGEPTEAEREEAARKLADAENAAAPSADEVELLNAVPQIEPVLSEDGSFVQAVKISRWVLGEDGRPTQVIEDA